MHKQDISCWKHEHRFDAGNVPAERNTWRVVWLSAVMMVVEIVTGWWFGSLALLADGWHMGTHVFALGITAAAYSVARRFADDPRFAFGTWKIEVLGGFTSAIVLGMVALMMVFESFERFLYPQTVQYDHALVVAVIGLIVNLASALLLHDFSASGHPHAHSHEHDHAHGHSHDHGHSHHDDLNLRAAYIHVLADATTSLLAIAALIGGRQFGWAWLDPSMGIVGSLIVLVWAKGLLVETSRILLDREMDHALTEKIRKTIESDPRNRICDLHVWRVGRRQFACILSVVSCDVQTVAAFREQLAKHKELAHLTVEVLACPEHAESPERNISLDKPD